MEVKINREIRNYTESIFFGLSLRQFICSILACGTAVGIYFLASGHVHKEIVSWLCILGALPFAGLGFFKYNGMPLEDFLVAFIKSEILTPRKLKFESENIYYEAMKENIENKMKEDLRKNDKIVKKSKQTRKGQLENSEECTTKHIS